MKIKKDCNNCKYYPKLGRCLHSEICRLETLEYWEPREPFDRYDITGMIIDPCPLKSWCPNKTAPCSIMPPDDGCYWYRYFKELIKNKKS